MKEYLERIIISYIRRKHVELKLATDHPALAVFDVFKGQQTGLSDILAEENIHALNVPPNCTDRLQPMDLSMNKSVKEFVRSNFKGWYASQILKCSKQIQNACLCWVTCYIICRAKIHNNQT